MVTAPALLKIPDTSISIPDPLAMDNVIPELRATVPPDGVITIQSGNTVAITANVMVDQVVIASAGTVALNTGITPSALVGVAMAGIHAPALYFCQVVMAFQLPDIIER